jgi:holo-[acyl-carrier protein] synthase
MIIGVGIDIVAVARLAQRLPSEPGLKEDLFTETEIAYCGRKARADECFAARFAAKEAFLKAIGTGWRDGLSFTQIEVVIDELGKPGLKLSGKADEVSHTLNVQTTHLSIAHESTHAVAVVILEK